VLGVKFLASPNLALNLEPQDYHADVVSGCYLYRHEKSTKAPRNSFEDLSAGNTESVGKNDWPIKSEGGYLP